MARIDVGRNAGGTRSFAAAQDDNEGHDTSAPTGVRVVLQISTIDSNRGWDSIVHQYKWSQQGLRIMCSSTWSAQAETSFHS